MWVIYHKKNNSVVGLSADADVDIDKELAIHETVKGLVKSEPLNRYDAIQITDRQQAQTLMSVPFDRLTLKTVKGKVQVAVQELSEAYLAITCDATDLHPVDGLPTVKADGESFTTVTVQKLDAQGKPKQGTSDNDLLYLRTDYGTLLSADGKEEISSLKLKKGQASFRLVSEKARRVATVQLFNADASVYNAAFRVEFA